MSGSGVSEVMLEEKLVELWPEYSYLYDVRSSDFKNRDRREVANSCKLFSQMHTDERKLSPATLTWPNPEI